MRSNFIYAKKMNGKFVLEATQSFKSNEPILDWHFIDNAEKIVNE